MLPLDLQQLARQTVQIYTEQKRRIVLAESCTGGLIAAALTDVPGASAVLERGFVTYSNEAKVDLLGVLPDLLVEHGAVSAEVADAMAEGALAYSLADVALSVTGIAGPGGGTMSKPVGLVFFGIATRDGLQMHYQCLFKGDRSGIRLDALHEGLRLLQSVITPD